MYDRVAVCGDADTTHDVLHTIKYYATAMNECAVFFLNFFVFLFCVHIHTTHDDAAAAY